jgi:DNA-binding NarL/FixJ family response regulator
MGGCVMITGKQKVRRVVIVDDSRTSQAILEAAFSGRREFRVIGVAANAADGEDLIRRLAPDLVTIDLCMPYIDGASMLETVRGMTTVCKVVVSDQAASNIAVAAKMQALGAALCIGKRAVADDPALFFKKVIKACERFDDGAIMRENGRLNLNSDPARKFGVRVHREPLDLGFPVPADEHLRLSILEAKQLANAVRERHFDRITQLTAEATGFPVCLLTFIDSDTQWIKSSYGYKGDLTSRADAICNHVIATGALFVVPNTTTDARFASRPFVVGSPGFRTYAGCPIVSDVGVRLGSLCILDTKVRPLTLPVTRKLAAFADIVSGIVEARPRVAA